MPNEPPARLTLEPIGYVRTPFADRQSAPRQPALAKDVAGRIELLPHGELEHALEDLPQWSHVWVIFWFHLNDHWRAKVAPPRSERRRGVFATRSPYRPNPLGLSVVALERVEGRMLYVRGVDMIDGTPVLDLKPYVPYTDVVDASSGWLADAAGDAAADPGPRYRVRWSPTALAQLEWLSAHAVELRAAAQQVLCAGPAPHPYRRIKREGDALRLSLHDWRLRFRVDADLVTVESIATGYRARVLADPTAVPRADTPLDVHRAFVERFRA